MKCPSSDRPSSSHRPATVVEPLEQRMLLYGTTVAINTAAIHQTIDGFGAAMESWTRRSEYSEAAFYDRIANDLGASIARVAVWPSFEKANDNNDPNSFNWAAYDKNALGLTMTFLKRLQDRGMSQFLATVWTPPAWMKTNQSHHYGGSVRPDLRDEFAEYLAAVAISAKRDWGVDLSHISPQNEPFFVQSYESGVATDVQMRELVRATMRKLAAEGLSTQLIAPEEMAKGERYNWYVDAIMNDPETASFPGAWGVHSATNPHWPEIGQAVGGKDHNLWMTESHGHDQTITGALAMAQDMFNALTVSNASTYLYWQWSGDAGDGKHSLMIDGQPAIKYHVAKHFYRYVRPGAVRIGATSGDSRLRTVSFKHPDTGAVTHVLFNPNGAPANVTINLSGPDLPTSYKQYRTSGTENHVQLANVAGGSQVNIALPADSIVTLYSGPDLAPVAATSGGLLPSKVNFSDGAITNSLRIAAARGDVNQVEELIAGGANVDANAFGGYSALHAAAMSPYAGATGVIEALINAGANIGATTSEGFTPLHMAAMNPWTRGSTTETSLAGDKIRALTAGGASVTAKDNQGRTALHWGAMMSKLLSITEMTTDPVVVDALLDAGSAVNAADNAGFTPLDYAVREVNVAGATELKSRGGVHGAGGANADTTPPTSDIVDVSPDPRTTAVDSIDVTFSEPVFGVDLGDFILMHDGATQSLSGATLVKVNSTSWRIGNLATATGATGQYMFKLEKAGSGITDAAGNALATSASDSWTVTSDTPPPPSGQPPFNGSPFAVGAIPVTIEAEHFDLGGQNVAYFDNSPDNGGGTSFRADEDVDLKTIADGGFRVLGTYAGEWIEYTIDVAAAGTYTLASRVSSKGSGGSFHIELRDAGTGDFVSNLTDVVTIPNTGGHENWVTLTSDLTLPAGTHVLRLAIDTNSTYGSAGNFDWMTLTQQQTDPDPDPVDPQQPYHGVPFAVGATPVTIEAEHFDLGGHNVAYFDNSPGNGGGTSFRADEDVDLKTIAGGGYRVLGTYTGEWIEYTIDVAAAGTYTLDSRVSSRGSGGSFHIELHDADTGDFVSNLTGTITIPNTGGHENWVTLTHDVTLPAGTHVLRLAIDTNSTYGSAGNFDWMKLTAVTTEEPSGTGTPVTIITTQVAYVRNGTYANTNFGIAEQMVVKRSNPIGNTREGCTKFDLSGVSVARPRRVAAS